MRNFTNLSKALFDDLPVVASPALAPTIGRDWSRDRHDKELEVPIEIRASLGRIVRALNDLIPFYGPASRTTLFELIEGAEIETVRGPLSEVRQWASQEAPDRAMVLLIR